MYIYPHNKAWKTDFLKECATIQSCFAVNVELYHVGSTAVSGLMSKNCIDIIGIIDDYKDASGAVKPLETIGYRYKGGYGIKGRHYFSKEGDLKVHLHVLPRGHEQIQRHLHFVQVMSLRPDLVEEFNQIKQSLSAQLPKEAYQDKKGYFYNKIRQISV